VTGITGLRAAFLRNRHIGHHYSSGEKPLRDIDKMTAYVTQKG
jgi:hypothetical protein